MANTYTQIHIHIVFAVQNRSSLISSSWKEDLHKYITGIVHNNGHKMIQLNSAFDHIHILIGQRPTQSLSQLVQYIKQDSAKWINRSGLCSARFSWQQGFGAFAHSKSDLNNVIHYIMNQENIHKKISFRDEYLELLRENEIEFDERYLFKEI